MPSNRLAVAAFLCCALSDAHAQTRLVNMIPSARSGERNQDAEPTLTSNPSNRSQLVGSAFTWDNLTGGPMVTASAPVYVSADAGVTWSMAFIVPSKIGSGFPTGDITVQFSGNRSSATTHQTNRVFGGILSATAAGFPMLVLRSEDPFDGATLMTTLDTRTGNVDQPRTHAASSGASDRVYVGFNNGWGCIAPSGRSSTVDATQDGAIATPAFALTVIQARNTSCQDGFAQVISAHPDGTVYAAFIGDWNGTPRLVVVRDDSWGSGTAPFSALVDPSDMISGRFVTGTLTLPSGAMGHQRLGASNVSIAVDPGNSDRVYVAWGESGGTNSETIHVRRSTNRGVDWSGDLITVTNALNPQLAIARLGVVGLLYQRLADEKWETRLVRTKNLDGTVFDTGTVLAKQGSGSPAPLYQPYIGDYASLTVSGNNFIGMFAASNYPDKANFAAGVSYQREVDWATHKLYSDAAHTTEVVPSIDPFFFEAANGPCNLAVGFCNICAVRPGLCHVIYDPLWRLKCPACRIRVLVDPGDEFEKVQVNDSRGRSVGALEKLKAPVVRGGTAYTHAVTLPVEKDLGFVMRAEPSSRKPAAAVFRPKVAIEMVGGTAARRE